MKGVYTFALVVAISLLIGLFIAFPVMWLMNYLFTKQVLLTVFGIEQMTFWKALWLTVLCQSLFKCSDSSKD